MSYLGSDYHRRNALQASVLGSNELRRQKLSRIAMYEEKPKRCGHCQGALPYHSRQNRFCSKSCSATRNNKARGEHSNITRERIRRGVVARIQEGYRLTARSNKKVCLMCAGEFEPLRRRRQTCSDKCLGELRSRHAAQNRQRLVLLGRHNIQKQMQNGKWKGWSGQGTEIRSFPESFVEQRLALMGLEGYVFQCQVGRFSIDFGFRDEMIALEVDGKQHRRKEVVLHDQKRDEFLVSMGWRVFRLKWHSVKRVSGRIKVMEQLFIFQDMLNNK